MRLPIYSMTRRKRILLGLSSTFAVLILYLLFLGWTMTQMPGKSYCGELPEADASLKQLAEELHEDVAVLAGEIVFMPHSLLPALPLHS